MESRFCLCCQLRLKNCRDASQYKAAYLKAEAAEDACGLCLGLFESGSKVNEKLGRLLHDGFRHSGCRSYELLIQVPPVCTFQHMLLEVCLSQKPESGVSSPPWPDAKQVLQWITEQTAAAPFASTPDSDLPPLGALKVSFAAKYEGPELSTLQSLLPKPEPHAQGKGKSKGKKGKKGKKRRLDADESAKDSDGSCLVTAELLQERFCALDNQEIFDIVRGGEDFWSRCFGRFKHAVTVDVDAWHESMYLRGCYSKFSRNLPQSPWFIAGERKGESSVEELISLEVKRLLDASDVSFHAEGREDVDVRMLSGGRPFGLEVKKPRTRPASLLEIEAAVNAAALSRLKIWKLSVCNQHIMCRLQRDAEDHKKRYICICWTQRPLTSADMDLLSQKAEFEVIQKTPVRVLHRRALADRPRTVFWMQATKINSHFFRLRLLAQSGMYIKEFVHGDHGRTVPNISQILDSSAEILQLDVEGLDSEDGVAEGTK